MKIKAGCPCGIANIPDVILTPLMDMYCSRGHRLIIRISYLEEDNGREKSTQLGMGSAASETED